jgi:mRNA interferase HigB
MVWPYLVAGGVAEHILGLFPNMEHTYIGIPMQIIAKRTIRLFWERHPQAESPFRLWFAQVSRASWAGPADIRAMFGSADFIADNRVIFNIGGNKYRLVAHVSYAYSRVLIKFVGTDAEYDAIKPESV